jgi:hypothetical protein
VRLRWYGCGFRRCNAIGYRLHSHTVTIADVDGHKSRKPKAFSNAKGAADPHNGPNTGAIADADSARSDAASDVDTCPDANRRSNIDAASAANTDVGTNADANPTANADTCTDPNADPDTNADADPGADPNPDDRPSRGNAARGRGF